MSAANMVVIANTTSKRTVGAGSMGIPMTATMLPLYSELHSVVRDMEADHVIANGGYRADNAYWGTLTDVMAETDWKPWADMPDYRWTFARLTVMAVA